MSEQDQKHSIQLYAGPLLHTATGLSSSMAVSTTVFVLVVYLATLDVAVVPVGDNSSARTVPKLAFLLPPIISSWLYFTLFAYMLARLPPALLRLGPHANVGFQARTILFSFCFGLLLLQNVKTVESLRNCITILSVQRSG